MVKIRTFSPEAKSKDKRKRVGFPAPEENLDKGELFYSTSQVMKICERSTEQIVERFRWQFRDELLSEVVKLRELVELIAASHNLLCHDLEKNYFVVRLTKGNDEN